MKRIHLVSNPRNLSTALMYAFAQRRDTSVLDEPFYGHYLAFSGAPHPGREEILKKTEKDPNSILDTIFDSNAEGHILFIKNMAHHLGLIPITTWLNCLNVIYIRDPLQVITSFARVVNNPTIEDVGYAYQLQLLQFLKRHHREPIVLDAGILLQDPENILRQLCEKLAIPFDKHMLNWKKGPKTYDGIWAQYWYQNVHQSTTFVRQDTSSRRLPEQCSILYETCKPIYDALFTYAIKISP